MENNIELHKPVETSSIRFRIDSVYKESNYSDTCVSDIRVYGTSSAEEKEAEEISITDKELGLISISRIDDTLVQDIKYATEENFTGSDIYETAECFLNIDVAKALSEANKELRTHERYGMDTDQKRHRKSCGIKFLTEDM